MPNWYEEGPSADDDLEKLDIQVLRQVCLGTQMLRILAVWKVVGELRGSINTRFQRARRRKGAKCPARLLKLRARN